LALNPQPIVCYPGTPTTESYSCLVTMAINLKNAWNVALWIGSDESLYHFGLDCLKRANGKAGVAARYFMQEMQGERTPDGGIYNHTCVKLALGGLV